MPPGPCFLFIRFPAAFISSRNSLLDLDFCNVLRMSARKVLAVMLLGKVGVDNLWYSPWRSNGIGTPTRTNGLGEKASIVVIVIAQPIPLIANKHNCYCVYRITVSSFCRIYITKCVTQRNNLCTHVYSTHMTTMIYYNILLLIIYLLILFNK